MACAKSSAPPAPPPAAEATTPWVGAIPGPEVCFNATDDNANGLLDEGCAVEQGQLQFLLAWQPSELDLDLWVSGPSGETARVGKRSADGLVKMQDCPGAGQQCQSQNQENVLLEGAEPEPGEYLVRVRVESLGDREPPVEARLGVRIGGKTQGFLLRLGAVGSEVHLRLREIGVASERESAPRSGHVGSGHPPRP